MIHGKLLPFVTKTIYAAVAIKIWFQDFGPELLSMASIEF